jgi:putative redox protein
MSTHTRRLSKFQFEVECGSHKLISDVPVKTGGEDKGMSPHELLKSALAACTAITMQMYADHKKWPLLGSNVQVTILSEGPEGTEFERVIELEGALTAEQQARLIEMANKCPLHKLLSGKITITTRNVS